MNPTDPVPQSPRQDQRALTEAQNWVLKALRGHGQPGIVSVGTCRSGSDIYVHWKVAQNLAARGLVTVEDGYVTLMGGDDAR